MNWQIFSIWMPLSYIKTIWINIWFPIPLARSSTSCLSKHHSKQKDNWDTHHPESLTPYYLFREHDANHTLSVIYLRPRPIVSIYICDYTAQSLPINAARVQRGSREISLGNNGYIRRARERGGFRGHILCALSMGPRSRNAYGLGLGINSWMGCVSREQCRVGFSTGDFRHCCGRLGSYFGVCRRWAEKCMVVFTSVDEKII